MINPIEVNANKPNTLYDTCSDIALRLPRNIIRSNLANINRAVIDVIEDETMNIQVLK